MGGDTFSLILVVSLKMEASLLTITELSTVHGVCHKSRKREQTKIIIIIIMMMINNALLWSKEWLTTAGTQHLTTVTVKKFSKDTQEMPQSGNGTALPRHQKKDRWGTNNDKTNVTYEKRIKEKNHQRKRKKNCNRGTSSVGKLLTDLK